MYIVIDSFPGIFPFPKYLELLLRWDIRIIVEIIENMNQRLQWLFFLSFPCKNHEATLLL